MALEIRYHYVSRGKRTNGDGERCARSLAVEQKDRPRYLLQVYRVLTSRKPDVFGRNGSQQKG